MLDQVIHFLDSVLNGRQINRYSQTASIRKFHSNQIKLHSSQGKGI